MSDTIITVENLSKSYLVGHKSADQGYKRYVALRDTIAQNARNILRNSVNIARGRQLVLGEVEEFWALKDISFEVKRGEVLGIIGHNGAGKSTLLKILSRITEPTAGRAILCGRVASLLEVGTGFHPELTGRENIYLNGAILGMSRAEIRRKFDEIVAFAEVEKFLDTPVKRYSSGMYVRLAFAVAAHLEPEILIVDEVLAVGDIEFQRKCLGKMSEVARESRTVLFVSHNMGAITALTKKCILMEQGKIVESGDAEDVSAAYLTRSLRAKAKSLRSEDLDVFRRRKIEDAPAKILGIKICRRDGDPDILPEIQLGDGFTIDVKVAVYEPMQAADFTIVLRTPHREPVTSLAYSDRGFGLPLKPGSHVVKVTLNDLFLAPGRYLVEVAVDPMVGGYSCDVIDDYPLLSVASDPSKVAYWPRRPWGAVWCRAVEWEILERDDMPLGTVPVVDGGRPYVK